MAENNRTPRVIIVAQLDKLPAKGRVYRFRKILFWAQGGCICIERMDQDGEFKVVQRADFAARIIQFKKTVDAGHYKYADERIEAENFVVNGCAAVKEGKHQGDPFDPEVLAQQLRARQISKGYIYLGDGSKIAVSGATQQVENPPGKVFIPGPGQKVVLHTHSQSEFPDRVAELPPFGPPARGG